MDIVSDMASNGIYTPTVRQAGAAGSVESLRARRAIEDGTAPEVRTRPADSVDISALARRLGLITTGQAEQPYRAELVERVRAEIDAGTYETPERLDGAAARLARDLDVAG